MLDKSDEFDAAKEWGEFQKLQPALTLAQVDEMEQGAQRRGQNEHVVRRIALMTLAHPTKHFIDIFREDRNAALSFAEALRTMDDQIQYLDSVREVLSAARMRISFSLAVRGDMDEILKEAKTT
ncbi:MAG: hypothetical protein K0U79_15115 [Gammaproteobacteria bacterium]|nr:hypothetical protein [Gammaproteobacteria bacterium]